jgi:hypothetical protein
LVRDLDGDLDLFHGSGGGNDWRSRDGPSALEEPAIALLQTESFEPYALSLRV